MVQNVERYSFSQFEDGTFGFWAGGKAGWFELIEPTRSFRQLFEDMNEATHMLYFLVDKSKNSRKSFSKATARDVAHHTRQLFNVVRDESCSLRSTALGNSN